MYPRIVFQPPRSTYITITRNRSARDVTRRALAAPLLRHHSVYSYLDLEPQPQVHYIRDVDEADRRVATLEGYAATSLLLVRALTRCQTTRF